MRCVNQKQLLGAGLQLSVRSLRRHVSQLSGSLGTFNKEKGLAEGRERGNGKSKRERKSGQMGRRGTFGSRDLSRDIKFK